MAGSTVGNDGTLIYLVASRGLLAIDEGPSSLIFFLLYTLPTGGG